MFNFFKRKKKAPKKPPLVDLNQSPLTAGDMVDCMRYEMGLSKVVQTVDGIEYESVATGTRVSWVRMIDASTEFQKVKKVEGSDDGKPAK